MRKPIQFARVPLRMFAIQPTNMRLAILANKEQKQEWLLKTSIETVELMWVDELALLPVTNADAYFDLEFQNSFERWDVYAGLKKPLFINDVVHSLSQRKLSGAVFRLNAWPGFLNREWIELAAARKEEEEEAKAIFAALGWKYKLVEDIPGMITARILAMIINEAYYTLEAGVSTREEIDIAMKLGTNYPFGPFEWSNKIGLENIYELLLELSRNEPQYTSSVMLKREVEQAASWH